MTAVTKASPRSGHSGHGGHSNSVKQPHPDNAARPNRINFQPPRAKDRWRFAMTAVTAVTVRRPKKFNPLPHGLGIEVGWSDHLVASPGSGNTLIQRTAQIAESRALSYGCSTSTRPYHTTHQPSAARAVRTPCRTLARLA